MFGFRISATSTSPTQGAVTFFGSMRPKPQKPVALTSLQAHSVAPSTRIMIKINSWGQAVLANKDNYDYMVAVKYVRITGKRMRLIPHGEIPEIYCGINERVTVVL